MKAYEALVAESERLGMPRSFKTDLTTHDKAWIERHSDAPFLWCLYEGGTHLMSSPLSSETVRCVVNPDGTPIHWTPAMRSVRWRCATNWIQARDVITHMTSLEGARLYEWNGCELRPCTPERAAQFLSGEPEEEEER